MPIWKQRLFSRLQAPADEGSDLGGGALSATEAAMDAIGNEPPDPQSEAPQENQGDEAPPEGAAPDNKPNEPPGSKMKAMLDELADGPSAPKAEAKPGDKPDGEKLDPIKPEAAKTPEQEEAELLDGVKSERGKDRIKQVFAKAKALEADIGEFRGLVTATGMNAQEFAQTLEFGRLMNSGDEKNLRVALEMVEGQRQMLYARLGVEAPGIDLLAGHDDLKSAVDNMEITRDRAVELAKFRRVDGEQKQRVQVQQQSQQEHAQFTQTVQQASGQMEAYLSTRAAEVDHPARMRVLSDHFRNPAKMQEFVQHYRPDQWTATLKLMYDNIQAPRQASTQQPLRSRPTNLGTPSAAGSTPLDRVASRLDAMGI